MELNQVTSLFLAILFLLIGAFLVNKSNTLNRFSIPAPVIGGLLFAIIVFVLHTLDIVTISIDTSLQGLLMLVFFTTVGLGASMRLIRLGGKLLVIYLVASGILSFIQNTIGVAISSVLGIDPLIGLMASSPALIGGHGGAAAFGSTIEGLGVEGAITVGVAAATLGLVAGGIIGGPIARYLIKKHNLSSDEKVQDVHVDEPSPKLKERLSTNEFFIYLALITFSMTIGSMIGDAFSEVTGVVLPGYVSAMFVAVIVRTIIDITQDRLSFNFDIAINDSIGSVSLGLFLAMAMMSIQLWDLAELALPLFIILILNIIFIVFYTIFVVFRVLGKNYDAAVMINGMLGHGLGATPTAVANMDSLTQTFGPSRTAFLIVPIVGAFLIDVINIPIIVFYINMFS